MRLRKPLVPPLCQSSGPARRVLPAAGQRRHRRVHDRARDPGARARRHPGGLDDPGPPTPGREPVGVRQPNPPGKAGAVIPVERIRGPVLLACGAQDLVWPSCAYVDAITARLHAHRSDAPVTALRYGDAGHLIGGLTAWYGSLTDDALTSFGGTVAGTQAAQDDAHAKLLAFLASQ
jgi:bile acid acyltransferase/acyl-CoA thioester hydrolase-like protein